MRFSDARAGAEVEDLLGALACALEARLDRHSPPDRADLLFSAAGVPPEERALLAELDPALASPGGLARVASSPARLVELSRRFRAARCLAAAHSAARAAPGPARVMGILNVTPDSFSDGGEHLDAAHAIAHGRALVAAGADLVDVGGESTRPGAAPVSAAVQIERVLPVVAALARDGDALVSVDTTRAEVARAALDAGACVVNDVSAGEDDPGMLPLVAERGAGLVLMHRRGEPRDMQEDPRYDDVVREVTSHLRARARAAREAGVDARRIALDPGIGFGKTVEHNLELLRALPELRSLGLPIVLGVSRKSFLGRLTDEPVPARRGAATLAAVTLGAFLGAEIHRVHEVEPARAALRIAEALAAPRFPADRGGA